MKIKDIEIAQIIPLLLSKYSSDTHRATIIKLLARIVSRYSNQNTLWLIHSKYFYKNMQDKDKMDALLLADNEIRIKFYEVVLQKSIEIYNRKNSEDKGNMFT